MRKRFEQQLKIGSLPIGKTEIPTARRSRALPGLRAALKEIFITPKWNEKIFEILDREILSGKNQTGRPGMLLWQIFILSHQAGFKGWFFLFRPIILAKNYL